MLGTALFLAAVCACFFGPTTKESRILMRSERLQKFSTDPLYYTGISVPDGNGRVAFYRKVSVFPRDEKKLEKLKGEKRELSYTFDKMVYSFGDNREYVILEADGKFSLFEFQNYYYTLDPAVLNLSEDALDGYVFGEVSMGYVFAEVYGIHSSDEVKRVVVTEREGASRLTLRKEEKDTAFNVLNNLTLGEYTSSDNSDAISSADTCKITVHYGVGQSFSFFFNGDSGLIYYLRYAPNEGSILSSADAEAMRQIFMSKY